MHKVNLAAKFSQIREYWSPHIAGELNGQMVKLTKLKGEFVWHHHENEDELFLVVKGRFRMEFRDSASHRQRAEETVPARQGHTADKSVRATQDYDNAGEGARATRTIWIEEGEFIIVPRGVEHRPVADEECWIVLFEPASTLNTGNVDNEFTRRELERV
jgi:mannose-6-phosphate isomerase-like protein (cupin superfamily)